MQDLYCRKGYPPILKSECFVASHKAEGPMDIFPVATVVLGISLAVGIIALIYINYIWLPNVVLSYIKY